MTLTNRRLLKLAIIHCKHHNDFKANKAQLLHSNETTSLISCREMVGGLGSDDLSHAVSGLQRCAKRRRAEK